MIMLSQRMRILLLFILAGIIFAGMFVVLLFPFTKPENSVPFPTPTEVPAFIKPLTIISFTPSNNESAIALTAPITITFSRPLAVNEQQLLTLTSTPALSFTKSWNEQTQTLSFISETPLQPSTLYTLVLTSPSFSKEWSFTTRKSNITTSQEAQNAQSAADQNYNLHQEELQKNYPWLSVLPLQTNDYFVYFDTDTKTFRATLYVNDSDQPQINTLKKTILSQMQQLEIPTETFPITWITKP